jgi:hypothetical protein
VETLFAIAWNTHLGVAHQSVFEFKRLVSVDQQEPSKQKAPIVGILGCLNYVRYGAANGVMFDSGVCIHIKPKGMARPKLQFGDTRRVEAEARPLSGGNGGTMEAIRVNGKRVKRA